MALPCSTTSRCHPASVGSRASPTKQVDFVLGECLELLGHRQVKQVERHVRPHLAKAVEGGRQEVIVHVGDVADVQRAVFTQAQATHILHVGARLGEQTPGAFQEETSGFRQSRLFARVKSGTPNCLSRFLIWRVSQGWASRSLRAARVTLSSSATVTK